MFGMSSKEFWEDDPKLYWAYRTFYLKKLEIEQTRQIEKMKFEAWLNGSMTELAVSISLNNAFSKQPKKFPTYAELFEEEKTEETKSKSVKDINLEVQAEFNAWARK